MNSFTRTNTFARSIARLGAALAAVAFSSFATAQDLMPKAPEQDGTIHIVGATVHTIAGDVIESGVVTFKGGVLTRVSGGAGAFTPPAGDEVIRAAGLHVYPGLIAPRTNLGHVEVEAVRATIDYDETGSYTPEVRAAAAVNPDSTLIPVSRATGILLAGVFPQGGRVPGRAAVVRLDGWTWEDMALDPYAGTGAGEDVSGLVIDWPVMRPVQSRFVRAASNVDEDRVMQQVKEIEIVFDTAEAYRDAKAADPDHPTDLRLEAMLSYMPSGTGDEPAAPTFILADDLDEIMAAVTFATARGLRPVIVGGHDAPLCAEVLKTYDVPVIVRGAHRFPKRRDSAYDEAFSVAVRLHEAGVRFCIDTTDRTGNIRNLPFEAAVAARHGLPVAECVRAITLSPAEILEIDRDYGSLEVDKSATLIVTSGNPLEITTDVLMAFIDGRRIDLGSKQTYLLDKYAEKYRQLGILDD